VSDIWPTWSPDGTKIAFTSTRDGNEEVYVMNADGSGQTNLTNHPASDIFPAWSPDGTKIAFTSGRDFDWEVFVVNADGSSPTNLTNNDNLNSDLEPDWSPDGTKIAFRASRYDSYGFGFDIYVMNADGSGQINLTEHPAFDSEPAWSPDGAQIVFQSDRDGNFEIYVMNADGSGQTNLTNNPASDFKPDWQPLVGNIDTTPPVVTCTVKPTILQPADHKMKTVKATVTVTDEGSGPAGFVLMSVVSTEPDAGLGTNDRPDDIQGFAVGTADTSGKLRAERAHDGPGRVYTLTYRGMDNAGNVAECAATVTVP
jgi:Tol biopolymer transport system component